MWAQLRGAAGYLTIFIVPLLLIVGMAIEAPALAFGFVMVVLPMLRPVFGTVSTKAIVWHETSRPVFIACHCFTQDCCP